MLIASLTSALGLRTLLLKNQCRKPLVAYITGLAQPRIGYRLGMSADRVLVGNEFLQQWLPGAGVIPSFAPIHLKSNAAGPDRSSNTFKVLFLGSMDSAWGVEYLLHAMSLVSQRTKRRVQLIIAWNGGGAGNYNNIQQLIDKLDIRSLIDLRGQVDINLVYREADVLVIPRASQEKMAFPVRIVEAIYMHKPVIVTRICGMEDLVEGFGLAVEPRDADALAHAILDLLHNEALRTQLVANCDAASKRFNDRAALDNLFNELVEVSDK